MGRMEQYRRRVVASVHETTEGLTDGGVTPQAKESLQRTGLSSEAGRYRSLPRRCSTRDAYTDRRILF
jgi:hypothetical protein